MIFSGGLGGHTQLHGDEQSGTPDCRARTDDYTVVVVLAQMSRVLTDAR